MTVNGPICSFFPFWPELVRGEKGLCLPSKMGVFVSQLQAVVKIRSHLAATLYACDALRNVEKFQKCREILSFENYWLRLSPGHATRREMLSFVKFCRSCCWRDLKYNKVDPCTHFRYFILWLWEMCPRLIKEPVLAHFCSECRG